MWDIDTEERCWTNMYSAHEKSEVKVVLLNMDPHYITA